MAPCAISISHVLSKIIPAISLSSLRPCGKCGTCTGFTADKIWHHSLPPPYPTFSLGQFVTLTNCSLHKHSHISASLFRCSRSTTPRCVPL
ncbi:hypothetical protein BD408DRAFT_39316 [Parasitella parasitica]|nr:hypothetical protein BD408DRAFT_39316 [Parasitella parasitica]